MKKRLLTLILASLLTFGGCASAPEISMDAHAVAQAEYPAMAPYPNEADYMDEKTYDFNYEAYEADFLKWEETASKTDYNQMKSIVSGMAPFVRKTAAQLLADAGTENRAYSPLNLYFAPECLPNSPTAVPAHRCLI